MGRLSGKVAIITGAGGGIGREAAIRFAEEGAQVVIADINSDAGEISAEMARLRAGGTGGDALAVRCDISKRASVEAAVAETLSRYGRLDILYNNAGGSTAFDGPVTNVHEDEFWRAITLDLFGTFMCCKIAIPELIKSGGGVVINASSIVALRGYPGHDCYTAAKGGVAALTRSMAVEYAAQGIRVNAIAPGVTLTDRVKDRLAASGKLHELAARHLLGLAQPIEIAEMALFLASDASSRITGQVLSADGGASA